MIRRMKMKRRKHVEVFQARDGWRWRVRAANGEITAQSEVYANKSSAMRAARATRMAVVVK